MESVQPLGSKVFVRRDKPQEETASGIIVKSNDIKEKPNYATVVAVGTGKVLPNGSVRPMELKVGDRVLIGQFDGQAVKVGGDDLLVIDESDVLAVEEATA
jgi:chaperonin GroES